MISLSQDRPIYRNRTQRRAFLRACRRSLYFLGKHILGYSDAMEEPHRRICEFSENPYERRKFIIGARGIYKTSFCTKGRAIQIILQTNGECRILIVSNKDKNAERIVGSILDEFKRNRKLRELAPHLIPDKTQNIPWSRQGFQLNRKGVHQEPTVLPSGVGSQLASLHFTHILFDDPVAADQDDVRGDDVIVIRPEDVDKFIATFKLAVEGLSINRPGHETEIQLILNRWGVQDGAQYMLDEQVKSEENPHGFALLELPAHLPNGELLWPEGLSEEKLERIRRFEGDFIYHTQYECRPYVITDRRFDPELNELWSGVRPVGFEHMRLYCLMDIADKTKPAHCYTAIVVAGVSPDNHIWVVDAERAKVDPDGKMDMMHRMVTKWDLNTIYVEENLHSSLLAYVLKQGQITRGRRYRVHPLRTRNRNKDQRIECLLPHHNRGCLHVKESLKCLLSEMRDFPFSFQKDTLDALAYIMDFVKAVPKVEQKERPVTADGKVVFTIEEIKADIDHQREIQYASGGFFKGQKPKRHDYFKTHVA